MLFVLDVGKILLMILNSVWIFHGTTPLKLKRMIGPFHLPLMGRLAATNFLSQMPSNRPREGGSRKASGG
jgi:hypothetical protein